MSKTNQVGNSRYFVTLEGRAESIPVKSDSYAESGRFFAFYNNVDGGREIVAIFATGHVVAIQRGV